MKSELSRLGERLGYFWAILQSSIIKKQPTIIKQKYKITL